MVKTPRGDVDKYVRAFAWVVVHAAKRVVQEFEHRSVQLAALRQRPLEG